MGVFLAAEMEIADAAETTSMQPLFSTGLVADTQYALLDDRTDPGNYGYKHNEAGDIVTGNGLFRTRRYASSLDILYNSISYFQSLRDRNLHNCVLLGDVLDKSARDPENPETLRSCVDAVFGKANESGLHWNYVVGNNDFQCFSRDDLFKLFVPDAVKACGVCSPSALYWDSSPHPGFRFIFLDSFDISALRRSPLGVTASSQEHHEDARRVLAYVWGPHWNTGGEYNYNCDDRLQRYRSYNGAIGAAQLDWLRNKLQAAERVGERVVIFAHVPIFEDCCRPDGLAWNYKDILAVIHETNVVQAVICGHDHDGGYGVDHKGIHHIVPPAPIEAKEGDVNAFGHVEFHESYFQLIWKGLGPYQLRKHDLWPNGMKLAYR